MEINFKANLISKTYVRKLNPTAKKFVPHEVSFVEINPLQESDIKALKKMSKLWGDDSIFANTIYYFAKRDPRKRTFILTEQEKEFEKLEPEKILGLTQLTRELSGIYDIEYLETKPEYQLENKNREYKKIGSQILDCLKKVFYESNLKVDYIFDRVEFYMKNGFIFEDAVLGDLVWKAPKNK